MSIMWSPWHGCRKVSEGCKFCYVYRQDKAHDKCGADFYVTKQFNLPVKRGRDGEYKIKSGEVIGTCLTSDFFLDLADDYREKAWDIIRERKDLNFVIFTKRIERFKDCIPSDCGEGWDNVWIGCTCENQRRAEQRLPIFLQVPIKHRVIICAPLLENLDLTAFLSSKIEEVTVGGESGINVRVCDFDWVKNIQRQCIEKNVSFTFHQTGARLRKNGKIYIIPRKYQHSQAKKAGLNFDGETPCVSF